MPNIKLSTLKQVALQTDELLFIDSDTTLERQVENVQSMLQRIPITALQ